MSATRKPLAVLFPGQGSQEKGMGRALAEASAEAAELWRLAEKASGLPLREIYWEGDEAAMADTRALQPAMTAVTLGLWFHLQSKLSPVLGFAGHSLGEYAALTAAGMLSVPAVFELTSLRGRLMNLLDRLNASRNSNGSRKEPSDINMSSVLSVGVVLVVGMGVTLPLLVKALTRRPGEFGKALGRLYGVNTLGACLGALLGETLLIAPLGLSGTGLVAAGFNVLAAMGALAIAPRFREAPPTETEERPRTRTPLSGRTKRLLGAGFLAGGAFLALEVVWTRLLQLFVRSTSLAFAVMLAVILAGIGLGGVLAGWWLRREADGRKLAAPLALLTGAMGLASAALFGPVSASIDIGPYQYVDWRFVAILSVVLMNAAMTTARKLVKMETIWSEIYHESHFSCDFLYHSK